MTPPPPPVVFTGGAALTLHKSTSQDQKLEMEADTKEVATYRFLISPAMIMKAFSTLAAVFADVSMNGMPS